MQILSDELLNEWQSIIDVIAKILNVPSALIMKLNKENIEVFLSSDSTGNPYKVGSQEHFENSGLYCETVINTNKMLMIPNALEDPVWCDNPDVKLNMISYVGFPIIKSDGKPFGTICALDNKANNFSSEYINLLEKFRNYIQNSIKLININEELKILSSTDVLTNIDNRRSVVNKCEIEIDRAVRQKTNYSLLLIDIDNFKPINDKYGHKAGDLVLKEFVSSIKLNLRQYDIFGRYGGEEFVILLPNTKFSKAELIGKRICNKCENTKFSFNGYTINFTVSIGIRFVDPKETNTNFDILIRAADKALYNAKENGKNQICISTKQNDV